MAKVETGVNVGRVLRDANTLAGLLGALGLARANGLPSAIPPRARRILVRSVTASLAPFSTLQDAFDALADDAGR